MGRGLSQGGWVHRSLLCQKLRAPVPMVSARLCCTCQWTLASWTLYLITPVSTSDLAPFHPYPSDLCGPSFPAGRSHGALPQEPQSLWKDHKQGPLHNIILGNPLLCVSGNLELSSLGTMKVRELWEASHIQGRFCKQCTHLKWPAGKGRVAAALPSVPCMTSTHYNQAG